MFESPCVNSLQRETRPALVLPPNHACFRRLLAACLSAAFVVAIAGCSRPRPADVVATVNGRPIQRAELERYYRGNLGEGQRDPAPVQASIARLDILRQLIDDEILQQRAAKLNLVATDEEVDAKLAELKAPFTQEEFNQRLKSKSMTLDDLRRQIRRTITGDKLMNKEINSKINITDADISSYYNQNKAEFNLIEPQYHLAQIVVTSAPSQQPGNLQNNKAMNEAEARKKIDTLHNRLESGEDFGALAANFSEQPATASSGGDMGFITESQLHTDPSVYNSITRLKPGQITDVLPFSEAGARRPIGYAIYKLISKEGAGQRELNDPRVQQAIRQQLRDTRAQLLKNAYYEIIRDQARIQNYFAEDLFRNGAQ